MPDSILSSELSGLGSLGPGDWGSLQMESLGRKTPPSVHACIVHINAAEVPSQDSGSEGELQAEKAKAHRQAGRWSGTGGQGPYHIQHSICEHVDLGAQEGDLSLYLLIRTQ